MVTATAKKATSRTLTDYERETIINFNEGEATADIFTYNRAWQRHLEGKLGLKPIMDNGFGGREYQLPKGRIRLPQPKKQYSDSAKKAMAARLARARGKQPTMI